MNHTSFFSIFLLLFFAITNALGQTRIYHTSTELLKLETYDFDKDTIISNRYFRLYLDGEYYALECHHLVTINYDHRYDSHDSTFLSIGTYITQDNTIQMKDSLNGFSLMAVVDDENSISFRQGFGNVIDKTMVFYEETTQKIPGIINPIIYDHHLDLDLFRQNKDTKRLKFGYYESSFCKLNIIEDGRYVLFKQYPRDTISKGRWKREGNLLALMDEHLDQPFYATLEKERGNKITIPTMPWVLFNNTIIDKTFIYTGYDENIPPDAELAKPMMGKDYLNAVFNSNTDAKETLVVYFYDNEYSIEQMLIDYGNFDAIIFVHTISYGQYSKDGFLLHLKDSLNGYEMDFELSADTSKITMTKGYCLWEDSSFYLVEQTWHYPDFAYHGDAEEITHPFDTYLSQDMLQPLHYGNYRFFYNGNYPHDLMLSEDGTFEFYVWDSQFSKGNWYRKGNVLLLYDTCIEQPFYILIDQDGIVPYLPGLFGKVKSGSDD